MGAWRAKGPAGLKGDYGVEKVRADYGGAALQSRRVGILLVRDCFKLADQCMKTRIGSSDDDHQHMFYFSSMDTLLLVEDLEDRVVIRATRDTFSERHKIMFIHELAAEGFIPNSFQTFSEFNSPVSPPLHWVVDRSWLKPSPGAMASARGLMIRLVAVATVIWLGSMIALIVFCARS